jgi:uncharacterized protein HemX
MTDSKDNVQPSALSHSGASGAAKSRSLYGLLLLWLVALFIAAAACAGGFLLDRKFSHAVAQLARRQSTTERALADIQSNMRERPALDTQQTQWAEQIADVHNRLQALENISQNSERGHEDWKVAEIEQMLATANEQLQWTGNTPLALFALQNAASRLAADHSPRAQAARRAVEHDIQVLQTSPYGDLAAKLDGVLSQIDALPLAGEPQPPALPAASTSSLPPAEDRAHASQWESVWNRFRTGMAQQWSNLVRIRRIDRDHALLLTPEQGQLAREHLKLRLLSARLALLARNNAALKTDVEAALRLLHSFDSDSPAAQSTRSALLEIEQRAQTATAPNIDASLQAVRQYKNRS